MAEVLKCSQHILKNNTSSFYIIPKIYVSVLQRNKKQSLYFTFIQSFKWHGITWFKSLVLPRKYVIWNKDYLIGGFCSVFHKHIFSFRQPILYGRR